MLNLKKTEELKLLTSLENVAFELGLNPHISRNRAGKNAVCRCPAPDCGDENHMILYENRHSGKAGIVYCLKCDFKGDVIKLIEKTLNVNGGKAIAWLVKFNGLQVSQFQND